MQESALINEVNTLKHRWIRGYHLDDFGYWSKKLSGINFLDLTVMRTIMESPDAIMREVADSIQVPYSTFTGIVDRLEQKGLIQRNPSKRDRRAFHLRLTRKGEELFAEHERIDRLIVGKMLSNLSPEEQVQFAVLLRKIAGGGTSVRSDYEVDP